MSRILRLSSALCLVSAILVALLSACNDSAPPSPSATATKSASAGPTAKPVPTGILRVGSAEWGAQALDTITSNVSDIGQMQLVFDWLVGPTPDQSDISMQTGLANKWETSPDGLTWTFTLRKGVMFDGGYGEATAQDVKFSIDRTVSPSSKASYAATLRAGIKLIEVVEPYTVRFNLNYPVVTLAYDLSPMLSTEGAILPKAYLDKVGDTEFGVHPFGSGPYRLLKTEKGLSQAFEARDDYWGGTPKYKQVTLSVVPEEATLAAMLKTGELDVAAINITSVKELEAAGLKMTAQQGAVQADFVFLDPTKGALADVRVREAINLAINKKEMLANLFNGQGAVMPQGVQSSWALGAKTFDPAPYDPQRAKDLLAQAGYSSGLEITIDYTPRQPAPLMSQAVAGYLEAVGIKTKLVSWDDAARTTFMRAADKDHTNHLAALAGSNKLFPVASFKQQIASGAAYAGISVKAPALDALIDEGSKATDMTKYAASVSKIQQYIHDNWTFVDVLHLAQVYASSPKIDTTGWTAGGRAVFKAAVKQLAMTR